MNLEGVLIEDRNHDTLLSAGKLQVRFTDWFIFKDHAELKYVGLENAIVKFQRTDSIWNYKFLQDYFAPPGAKPKKKAGINFDLKVAELKNVLFVMNDAWRGENMYVKVSKLDMDANELSFSGKNIDIKSLNLVQPVFRLYDYPGRKPSATIVADPIEISSATSIDTLLKWNSAGMVMHIGTIKIEDGFLEPVRISDTPPLTYFDGKHIEFSKIYGQFSNLGWDNDTITAKVNLKATERSGLVVKSLKADIKFHPQAMEFANLDLHTNNSVLKNYFAMHYKDFGDMNDFIHKVKMEADFTDADIDSYDIGFFAPSVRKWQKRIRITGKARGTIDDLKGDHLVMQAGNNTFLNGDITLSGLPNINQTFIDFKANDFKTTYTDAITMIPNCASVTKPDLAKLKYLHFNGTFTGFIRDFVTYGTIQTNLGTIKSDLNLNCQLERPRFIPGALQCKISS